MMAYLVTNRRDQRDTIVVPQLDCRVAADSDRMQAFISVNPDFSTWCGEACEGLPPEHFGEIIASRDDCGDVQIFKETLWRQKMEHYLGRVQPPNQQ